MRIKTSFKRLLAWCLSIMVAFNFLIPKTLEVYAANNEYLMVSDQSGSGTIAKDEYGPDYICDFYENNSPSSAFATNPSGFASITYDANITINTVSSNNLTLMLYAMNSQYGQWDQAATASKIQAGKTYDLSLSLKSYSDIGKLGIRVVDSTATAGATFTYTINYAKVVTSSSGAAASTTQASPAGDSDVSDVSLTLTEGNGSNQYYKEYVVKLTNNSSSSITGIQCLLPTSGSVSGVQCYGSGLKASYSSEKGGVLFYYSLKIDAGATAYSTDTKFGFSLNGATAFPANAKVLEINCASQSSSNLKYTLTGKTKTVTFADTPVGKHGALHLGNVPGYKAPVIVGEDGAKVNLRGASTHGMHWDSMTPYVNKGAFQSLRDEWGVNTVRLVSYVTQGGYTQGSQSKLDTAIQNGVSYAKDLGMYAIVDWHIHAENPWDTIDQAKTFFTKYATMYKDYDNVIFEICNEPTGVQWYTGGKDLYSYCKTISKIIRDCGSDAIIVCGTNTWSQDVDDVVGHELKADGFSNIMYTFHFYAASHYGDKMAKVTTAYNAGVPIFVTEFGTCDASGAGGYDFDNSNEWISLLDSYGIPYCNWSLCNKAEAASMLSTSSSKQTGGWLADDLSESGAWLVNTYRAHQDAEDGTDTTAKEVTTEGATTTEAATTTTEEATTTEVTTTEAATTEGVKDFVESISLDKTELTIKASSNATLKATVKVSGNASSEIKWSSNRPDVVSVDSNGNIVGLKGGKALVTAKSAFDATKYVECKVTVEKLDRELTGILSYENVTSDTVKLVGLGQDVEYGFKIKGANSYPEKFSDTLTFTGLSPYTEYSFAARYKETDIYNASNIIEVNVLTSVADKYEFDLSKAADEAYVKAHGGTVSYDAVSKTLTLNDSEGYKLTGTNKDLNIVSNTSKPLSLDDVSVKAITSTLDINLILTGNNNVAAGITTDKAVTFADNESEAGIGKITIANDTGKPAIKATTVTVSSGEVDLKVLGATSAISAAESVTLDGGSVDIAVGEGFAGAAIDTKKIVFNNTAVNANTEKIYGDTCLAVDKDGNEISFVNVYYVVDTASKNAKVRKGAKVTLPNLEAKEGFKAVGWKNKDKVYAVGDSVVVDQEMTFTAEYLKIEGALKIDADPTSFELEEGYSSSSNDTVITLTNNTNVTIDAITLSLTFGSVFALSNAKITSLKAGESTKVTVSLKLGLSEGEYNDTVTVTTSGEVAGGSVKVSRTVKKVAKEEKEDDFGPSENKASSSDASSSDAVSTIGKVTNVKLKSKKRKITVKWDSVPGAIKYAIFISNTKNKGYERNTLVSGEKTSYTITKFKGAKLKKGKKYFVKVMAIGGVSDKTTEEIVTPVVAKKKGKLKYVVSGDATVKNMTVYISNKDGAYKKVAKFKNTFRRYTVTFKKCKGKKIKKGKAYYIKVVNEVDKGDLIYGEYSDIIKVKCKK